MRQVFNRRETAMATVKMIEEKAANGSVLEVYDDIKETRGIGYVPNIWKTLATHPPTLKIIWTGIKSVMAPPWRSWVSAAATA